MLNVRSGVEQQTFPGRPQFPGMTQHGRSLISSPLGPAFHNVPFREEASAQSGARVAAAAFGGYPYPR
jgi:hypothetical protein